MAEGGIYDQIGGGFARYAVDCKWLVPHFEKMLYDNAQLIPLYFETYLNTHEDYFLQIAIETLNFVMRDLLSREGGFYSSLDADSDGGEGKYYIWKKSEIMQVLGKEVAEIFCLYYNVSENGNFEDGNILSVNSEPAITARKFNRSPGEIKSILDQGRKLLLTARSKRLPPRLDNKVLTSRNGLMLSAFARAYQITRDKSYETVIVNCITFLKKNL